MMFNMDFNNIDDVVDGIDKTINVKTPSFKIPTPVIALGSANKSGLSAIKIASRIIARKPEAGIPVGTLPSGEASSDDIMINIIVEEIVKAIQQEMIVDVAIPPGTTVSSAGMSPSGPVTTIGSTITFTKGYGVAQ